MTQVGVVGVVGVAVAAQMSIYYLNKYEIGGYIRTCNWRRILGHSVLFS